MAAASVMQLSAGEKVCAGNEAALQARFYPYDYNGGTVLAIAGPDYAIVAGDTRMSTGFNIKSRGVIKIFEVSPGTILGTGGFRGDITTLQKLLRAKVTQYAHRHREGMKPHSIAQVRRTQRLAWGDARPPYIHALSPRPLLRSLSTAPTGVHPRSATATGRSPSSFHSR